MLYYSELTKKHYPTEQECVNAETEYTIAEETKENQKKLDIAELAKCKANLDSNQQKAGAAAKAYSDSYTELTHAIKKFYNKYGYVPSEYHNINFLMNFVTNW